MKEHFVTHHQCCAFSCCVIFPFCNIGKGLVRITPALQILGSGLVTCRGTWVTFGIVRTLSNGSISASTARTILTQSTILKMINNRWYISLRNLMLKKIWVHLILNLWQPIYYFLSLYGSSRPFDKDFGLYHVALILSDLLPLYHGLSCYTTLQFTKTFFKKATAISFQFWSIFPRHQVPLLNVLPPQRANFMMLLLELRQRNFYVQ